MFFVNDFTSTIYTDCICIHIEATLLWSPDDFQRTSCGYTLCTANITLLFFKRNTWLGCFVIICCIIFLLLVFIHLNTLYFIRVIFSHWQLQVVLWDTFFWLAVQSLNTFTEACHKHVTNKFHWLSLHGSNLPQS